MTEKTINECFAHTDSVRDRVDKLEERHDKFAERVFNKLDDIEGKLVSRLPVWATLFIATLMGIVGWLISGVGK